MVFWDRLVVWRHCMRGWIINGRDDHALHVCIGVTSRGARFPKEWLKRTRCFRSSRSDWSVLVVRRSKKLSFRALIEECTDSWPTLRECRFVVAVYHLYTEANNLLQDSRTWWTIMFQMNSSMNSRSNLYALQLCSMPILPDNTMSNSKNSP